MGLITALQFSDLLLLQLTDWIKFIVIFELGTIVLAVFVLFFLRGRFIRQNKQSENLKKEISAQLREITADRLQLTKKLIDFYKKNILELTDSLEGGTLALSLNLELKTAVLQPMARRLGLSKHWSKQMIAIRCYQFLNLEHQDYPVLIHMLSSKILLVILGACKIIFTHPNEPLINTMIDSLSLSRKIYQDLFFQILSTLPDIDQSLLSEIFFQRLLQEKNTYTRCFCYRMIKKLLASEKMLPLIKQDITNENLDLRIAALSYLSCIPSAISLQILEAATEDKQFEIRALAVKTLGECKQLISTAILEKKLQDNAWWVRINAANALASLGPSGIAILRRQRPDADRFAYETSQKILITLEKKTGIE